MWTLHQLIKKKFKIIQEATNSINIYPQGGSRGLCRIPYCKCAKQEKQNHVHILKGKDAGVRCKKQIFMYIP